jgi:hypothetical protein
MIKHYKEIKTKRKDMMLEYSIIKTFLKDRSVFEKYYSKLKAIKFEYIF